jgi:dihydrofolate synthase/folylpolyglutamate synthase
LALGRHSDDIRDAAGAGAWLEGLINFERDPGFRYERMGLAPIRALLAELGDPQRDLSIVHVAGSKGKGSTALLLETMLGALGERVGTFTSPHLESWTERFRVGGADVDGATLAAAVRRVRDPVERLRRGEPALRPTFFDATTAAALLLFADAGVDRVVLEVGLGGRLDSTNVVDPAVTCITTIELEHTDKLGDTLTAIAGEKAGILKPGVPGVVGRLPEEAWAVVQSRAAAVGAPLFAMGRDFDVKVSPPLPGDRGVELRYGDADGADVSARLPLLGAHHALNAGLALACIRRLAPDDSDRPGRAAAGLAAARLPGRVEVVGECPLRIVDGAHTAASARALASALDGLPASRRHWLLSVSAGKDLDALLDAVLPGAHHVTVTRADPHRSLDPAALAAAVRSRADAATRVHVEPDPGRAAAGAVERAGAEDLLVATGSVYLAGIARSLWSARAPSDRGASS